MGLSEKYAEAIVQAIRTATKPLSERIAHLEQRCKTLETRPGLTFKGVWKPGVTYAEGAAVIRKGGLWIATEQTEAMPGAAASGWTLSVKRGEADL
jgi:hypothetical protein